MIYKFDRYKYVVGTIVAILMTLLFSFKAKGGEVDSLANNSVAEVSSLWEQAVEYYSQDNYPQAVEAFKAIEALGYVSPELYYNIGNAYYKMSGYIAYSILYYEKALKLDPTYEDAKANLEFVHQFTLDKIETVPEFVLVTWIKDIRRSLSSNGWGYLAIALAALVAIFILIFRFGSNMAMRRISFILAIICIIFEVFSVAFSVGLKNDVLSEDSAIVVTPVSSLKSSPNTTGKSLLILHEGAKVEILDELGEWKKVELSDGRQGWILTREIEII